MSKNILLVNEGHTSNLGDKLINATMSKVFERNNVISEKFVPIETDESMEEEVLVPPTPWIVNFKNKVIGKLGLTLCLNDLKYKKLIKKNIKNKDIDVAIIGGGELISDNANFNSAFYNWVQILSNMNIPVLVIGVSGNKADSKMSSRYKEMLSKCTLVSVRDKKTQELFIEEYNVNTLYVPDVAFLYRKLFNKNQVLKKDENSITVQIYCKHYLPAGVFEGTEEEYYDMWIDFIRENIKEDNCNIKLSYTNKEDRDYTREFYNYCTKKKAFSNISFEDTRSIEKYVKLISQTSTIITARMHAMILAMLFDNKLIPYIFKEKIEVFKNEWIDGESSAEDAERSLEQFFDQVKSKWELE